MLSQEIYFSSVTVYTTHGPFTIFNDDKTDYYKQHGYNYVLELLRDVHTLVEQTLAKLEHRYCTYPAEIERARQ